METAVRLLRSHTTVLDFKESNYGQKIDFYFETFYKSFTENLVNIDFLREEALKYDLKLIDTKLFNEEPDSIYDMFQKQRPDLWDEIENTPWSHNASKTFTKHSHYRSSIAS